MKTQDSWDKVLGYGNPTPQEDNPLDKVVAYGSPQAESTPWDQVLKYGQDDSAILPEAVPVTQEYGNYNPGVEVFSGGTNTGADFGTKSGTPLNLPPGTWEVQQAFKDAKSGYVGDNENSGYGNSVVVKNIDTGETLRFSHLSGVGLKQGQVVLGKTSIGSTGATGNVTGPHLDLEYSNGQGQVGDVRKSPYGRYLPVIN